MASATGAMRTAGEVMTPNPRTCSPFSSVLEAVMIFRDANCGAVPIVESGQPIGVLTDRDVALALAEFPDVVSRPVSDIMTRGAIAVTPETTLDQVEAKIAEKGVRRILVVDHDGALLGIVGWSDLAPIEPDQRIGEVVTDVLRP